ncbi:alpha/beta-hydrolase [Rhizodiscina lignyota]|uniref:Alpha/beta-hydrolase n=1 Tax=Rhizodiscina lignyota TaxID=1504668 RepID=A0A9P4IL29_9PEZI|nr:alpha/beta-hydrolase [Rhizodiscina lignyota]
MSSPKPTIAFSPGAWHDPACLQPITSILSSHGYKTHPVSLPSIGCDLRGEPPPQSWDVDVDAIRAALLSHLYQGEDVVLVVHSYSGTVGSEAVRGLTKKDWEGSGVRRGGVVAMVYMCAVVIPLGAWVWQRNGGKPLQAERTIIEGDLSYVRDTEPWFYNECSLELQAEAKKHLRSHAWKAFMSPLTYEAFRHLPSTYLMCENDQAVKIEIQEAIVAANPECWKIERCDGDHSPFLSRPEFTVGVIRKAAGEKL